MLCALDNMNSRIQTSYSQASIVLCSLCSLNFVAVLSLQIGNKINKYITWNKFPTLDCFAAQLDILADDQFSHLVFELLIYMSVCIHFMIPPRMNGWDDGWQQDQEKVIAVVAVVGMWVCWVLSSVVQWMIITLNMSESCHSCNFHHLRDAESYMDWFSLGGPLHKSL